MTVVIAAAAVVAGGAASGDRRPALAQDSGARMRLVSQSPWVAPGGSAELRVHVDGTGSGDLEIALVAYQRITSRSAFQLTLRSQGLGPVISVRTTPLDSLPRDASGDAAVKIDIQDPARPRDSAAIALPREGVYPLRVELRSRGEVVDGFTTHLVDVPRDTTAPPLGVVLVVPIRAPATLGADLIHKAPQAGRLLEPIHVLEQWPDTPLVITPAPETVQALESRASGASVADPEAQPVLAALRRVVEHRELVAGTYVPVDLPGLVSAGLGVEANAQVRQGRAVVERTLGAAVEKTWLADDVVDDLTVAGLAADGVSQIVVPETALAPLRLQVTLARPFLLEGADGNALLAAAADSGLADHFSNDDAALAAHQFLADLAVLFFDQPASRRAVVALPPPSWEPSRAFLNEVLTGLRQNPIVKPATLASLFDPNALATDPRGVPIVRTLVNADHSVGWLQDLAPRIRETRHRLIAFDQMVDDPSPLANPLSDRLLVSESIDLGTPARRRQYLSHLGHDVDAQVRRIQLPAPRTITFTARRGEIPLTVRNRTGFPAHTVVTLKSDKLEFRNQAGCQLQPHGRGQACALDLTLANTTKRFPVITRTSGTFPVTITLRSPETHDGDLQLQQTRFTVRSTAASGVGVVLSAGAGLFLLAWWGRHLVRGRRARRLVPA